MSLFDWGIVKGKFVADKNYIMIFGSWKNLLIILVGIGLLIAAEWVWKKAFRSNKNGEMIAKLLGAVVLLAGGGLFVTGWMQMAESGNAQFLNSLVVTLYYALGTVPAEIILGMVLAYILYQEIVGKEIFRMLYFCRM